jgi:alpha-glucosidase
MRGVKDMNITKSFEQCTDTEKKIEYFLNVRPVLNIYAMFSDAGPEYRIPAEPDANQDVTVRLRTAKYNVDEAYVYANGEQIKMSKASSDGKFDYYEATIHLGEDKVFYHFEVRTRNTVCYYNQIGVMRDLNPFYDFQIMPGFKTPQWAKGAVMYQIFVDRFNNGDPDNDVLDDEYSYIGDHVQQVKDWNENPSTMDVRRFYGGDLQGVMDKLDYLQDLGVDVVYFNPLFVSPSNHKYDIQDYDYIDPHFGRIVEDDGELLSPGDNDNVNATRYIKRVTSRKNLEASNQFFAELVAEIHRRGMKVIIDGVFNHCGSFNKWLDREKIYSHSKDKYETGAYQQEDSPYHDFFRFYGNQWPDNGSYDSWWGNDTLPKLNYQDSPTLEEYILRIGRKWVSEPYNVDGWRLDVAADLGYDKEYNHSFWRKFRNEVKKANPDAIILAENYGDSYDWLQGDQWDTIMNYDAFMEPVTWFLTGMQKHSDNYRQDMLGDAANFFNSMNHNMSRMGEQAYAISMNELSNHDHSRFLTRTNHVVGRLADKGWQAASQGINKAVFMAAVVIQMTWPGAPTIYYGDEAGVCGWTDPDNRRTYPWGHEDQELIDFHREIIAIHKSSEALLYGSYKMLVSDHNLICYGRFYGDDAAVVVVNISDDERQVNIPVWQVGLYGDCDADQVFMCYEGGYSTQHLGYNASSGWIEFGIRRKSAVVLMKTHN